MAMSEKDKTLVSVAAETARGDLAALESAYGEALAAGWTVQELKEVGTQAYAYCGFPKSLNSLGTLMKVAPEKSGGVNPSRPDSDSLVRGTKVQTELCGGPVKGALFEFAPAIDDYLKAHLFGDIFGRGILTWREREIATVAMLAALGNVKPQLDAHIGIAKRNGVGDGEIGEILEIVNDERNVSAFELGEPNPYKQFFSGRSWLKKLTAREEELGVPVYNVTFEPGCRNNWHRHTGGQMLIGVGGVGYYQTRGEKAVKILPGTIVEIPADVEHWHGAAPDSWFSHLAIETNPKTNKNTWLEPVADADYQDATASKVVKNPAATTAANDAWDKVFPKSDKIDHAKVSFVNRFGIRLVADCYKPKTNGVILAAIAVSGPFGAVKEQSSGLYAQTLAERGFLTIAFDPSFTGESGGEPRRVASPDINTEDFSAAVDYLAKRPDVDAEKIGIVGICGWGGLAINAAAADPRIKVTVASTMYDMTRVTANGYFDSEDSPAARREKRLALAKQRTADFAAGAYARAGGVPDILPADAPQFVKDYFDYYKTPRGFHPRSGNSTDGWNVTSASSFLNARLLAYAGEIESAVMVLHGEKAHSRYFGETAFRLLKGDNKVLRIVPGANHTDLYDGGKGDFIPWDEIEAFLRKNLESK